MSLRNIHIQMNSLVHYTGVKTIPQHNKNMFLILSTCKLNVSQTKIKLSVTSE